MAAWRQLPALQTNGSLELNFTLRIRDTDTASKERQKKRAHRVRFRLIHQGKQPSAGLIAATHNYVYWAWREAVVCAADIL